MFTLNPKLKNLITVILVAVIISVPVLMPLQTRADWPVIDIQHVAATVAGWAKEAAQWAVDNARWIKDNILKIAMAEALHQMTLAIVKWIDSGFKGNPAFITDTKKFLNSTADITIGDMLMGTDLDFLCDPFKIQIKLALGLQYQPFRDQIRCSFTSALGNAKDAMNDFTNGDFIGGGGWDSWLQLTTVPQNNQLGAMIIAQNELDARIATNKGTAMAEANWGGGFMSWKECSTTTSDTGDTSGNNFQGAGLGNTTYTDAITGASSSVANSSGQRINYYNDKNEVVGVYQENQDCTIQTPGSVISNKINWADSSDIRKTELANDVNAITNALVNQLVSNLTTGLLKRGTGGAKDSTARQDNIDYLNSLQSQLDAQNNYGANSGYYNNDGSINMSQNFSNKASALNTIDSQLQIENQYLATQSNIYGLLTAAQNVFTSSACSNSVTAPIVSQITGNYTGTRDLVLNKAMIAANSTTTINNISALNTARSAISPSSIPDSAVPNLVQSYTTGSHFNVAADVISYTASPSGTLYTQIKNWVIGKVNANRACVGDISALSTGWGIQ